MFSNVHLAPSPGGAAPLTPVLPIRVILADSHAVMRRSLRLVLDAENDMDVISEAEDLASVTRQVRDDQPDVLLLDLSMPGGSSVEAISQLRECEPSTQIVALTMEDDPVFAQRAFAAGAVGFVMSEFSDVELAPAVRAAVRAEEYISPRIAGRLDAIHRSLTGDRLTSREVASPRVR